MFVAVVVAQQQIYSYGIVTYSSLLLLLPLLVLVLPMRMS